MNNENRLDLTGLGYYHNRAKTVFADKGEFDTLSDKVDDIIAEGGEPNIIESISVNGTPQTITNKNVDLPSIYNQSQIEDFAEGVVNDSIADTATTSIASKEYVNTNGGKIDKIKVNGTEQTITNKAVDITVPTKASDLTNDGDGTSPFATEAYVGQNGGKIDIIKVNGTTQTITNKTVDLTVPTKVSDLTNDSNFQTDIEVEAAITAKLSSTYKAGGTVAFANLPSLTSTNEGKVYNVSDSFTTTSDFVEGAGKEYPAGTNVVIINVGTEQSPSYKYDVMAGFVDLSGYFNTTNLPAITTAQIDTLFS